MDFYSDAGESAYRPWTTVNALQREPGFEYRPGRLVTRFAERDGAVDVTCLRTDTGETEVVSGRRPAGFQPSPTTRAATACSCSAVARTRRAPISGD